MSFATSSPNALLADKEWRRKNSRWRWWVFLGFGLLGCVGFLIVAFRVQSRKFWTAAAIASIGSAVCALVAALAEPTDGAATTTTASADAGSDLVGGVAIAVWVAQIIYALVLNRDYLRWKADSGNEWFNQPVGGQAAANFASAPPPVQPAAPQAAPFLGVDTSAYFANAPAPQPPAAPTPPPPPPPPAATPTAATPQRSTPGPIDINSASAGEIAMAVGVEDIVVRRVVDARIQRGGFSSMEDLVARAGLQPHEMMRFRDKVTFGSSSPGQATTNATPAPTQPKPPTEPGTGRILDY